MVMETGRVPTGIHNLLAGILTLPFSVRFQPYPLVGNQGSIQARTANPGNLPDQFYAKDGYFHTRHSGKALSGDILAIGAHFNEIKIHLRH